MTSEENLKFAAKYFKRFIFMNTLTIQVESSSVLEQLKNILSLMKGVKIITSSPKASAAALEELPNATTLSAMKEVEKGHDAGTVHMDSLRSFMTSMEE